MMAYFLYQHTSYSASIAADQCPVAHAGDLLVLAPYLYSARLRTLKDTRPGLTDRIRMAEPQRKNSKDFRLTASLDNKCEGRPPNLTPVFRNRKSNARRPRSADIKTLVELATLSLK